jgi:predicted dehydrogenase
MTATSPTWKMHLYGSKGSAFLPNQHSLEVNVINTETEKTSFEIVDTLAIELDTFAQSVRGRCVYPVKISEALAGVSTMESIAKAAKTGAKTSVNSNFSGF